MATEQAIRTCACGCGETPAVARWSDKTLGYTKGQPKYFVHGHQRRTNAYDRFRAKTDATNEGGCWPWKAKIDRLGYGYFSLNGRLTGAHRASYELTNGPIPTGMHVLHRCDNRACVNPAHLFLGTHQDNMDDMVKKGRARCGTYDHALVAAKGSQHPMVKLSETQARAIYARRQAGERVIDLAREFGISTTQACKIGQGKSWRHLALAG